MKARLNRCETDASLTRQALTRNGREHTGKRGCSQAEVVALIAFPAASAVQAEVAVDLAVARAAFGATVGGPPDGDRGLVLGNQVGNQTGQLLGGGVGGRLVGGAGPVVAPDDRTQQAGGLAGGAAGDDVHAFTRGGVLVVGFPGGPLIEVGVVGVATASQRDVGKLRVAVSASTA